MGMAVCPLLGNCCAFLLSLEQNAVSLLKTHTPQTERDSLLGCVVVLHLKI